MWMKFWSDDQYLYIKKEEKIRYNIVSHLCLNFFSVYLSSICGGIYISLSLTQEIACRVSVWNNELQTSSPMPLSMINELRLVSVDIFCITKNILTNISPFIIQGNAIGIDNKYYYSIINLMAQMLSPGKTQSGLSVFRLLQCHDKLYQLQVVLRKRFKFFTLDIVVGQSTDPYLQFVSRPCEEFPPVN